MLSVHPRLRGELVGISGPSRFWSGSSPLARGTHPAGAWPANQSRFILACAGNSRSSIYPRPQSTVHPRLRGELQRPPSSSVLRFGSSPLARGTPFRCDLLPAACPVHPRLRGELLTRSSASSSKTGSSPLARGTPTRNGVACALKRFIPACAGNSAHSIRRRAAFCGSSPLARGTRGVSALAGAAMPVHPRLRGELEDVIRHFCAMDGSSPLARGTLTVILFVIFKLRFIPACAGNSVIALQAPFYGAVHPRLRGELGLGVIRYANPAGSSPLARGTPLEPLTGFTTERFIPACAGNSTIGSLTGPQNSVHPRLRGELNWQAKPSRTSGGSSPLARGTRAHFIRSLSVGRFIPACAGNSVMTDNLLIDPTVHPRLRGELDLVICFAFQSGRFIPACAGNSQTNPPLSDFYAVHPRLRGELWQELDKGHRVYGSSPLARGTHDR